jgi:hypothetical protein
MRFSDEKDPNTIYYVHTILSLYSELISLHLSCNILLVYEDSTQILNYYSPNKITLKLHWHL